MIRGSKVQYIYHSVTVLKKLRNEPVKIGTVTEVKADKEIWVTVKYPNGTIIKVLDYNLKLAIMCEVR